MNKIITILIITSLLFTGISATATITTPTQKNNTTQPTIEPTTTQDEILDQHQTSPNDEIKFGNFPNNSTNYTIAQSFIPQTEVLTRINILLARNTTTTQAVTLSIAKNLTDSPLLTHTIPAANISIYNNLSWIEFDFPDLPIIMNTTYHLFLHTQNITDNYYYTGTNTTNAYTQGTAYLKQGEHTTYEPLNQTDLCFEIYGKYLPNLEIGFVGGFGLTVCFTNYGLGDAHNQQYDIYIEGGMQGLIDLEDHGAYGTIPSGSEECVVIPVFGLGWVEITVKLNDLLVKKDAIVILVFIF